MIAHASVLNNIDLGHSGVFVVVCFVFIRRFNVSAEQLIETKCVFELQ